LDKVFVFPYLCKQKPTADDMLFPLGTSDPDDSPHEYSTESLDIRSLPVGTTLSKDQLLQLSTADFDVYVEKLQSERSLHGDEKNEFKAIRRRVPPSLLCHGHATDVLPSLDASETENQPARVDQIKRAIWTLCRTELTP
jgi:hypothetical protein